MNNNNIWEILGIEPTDNKHEIRAAYATKSKLYHPEEEPEEFVKLNTAYQAALKYKANSALEDCNNNDTNEEYNSENDEKNEETEPEKIYNENREPDTPLLSRLQNAEESEIEKSIKTGALKKFISIFEEAKERGTFPRADVWKEFFLSEEFLKEQYSDYFAKGMMDYLSNWSMEGNYHILCLPDSFLVELAVAYALMPEQTYRDSTTNKAIYQIHETGFFARETAADLWNRQIREYPPVRILYKPENFVRLRSFSDYMRLRNMNSQNALTDDKKESWYDLLNGGCVNHIYELKGKGDRRIYENTRSTTLLCLLTFWLQNEKAPKCILEHMYKSYDLKNIEHSSRKKLYAPLKQVILEQYPDIEASLFGEESKAQMISNWYRNATKIVADAEADFAKGIYEESEAIRIRVKQLFEKPEWPKIQYSRELFDKLYLQLIGREALPDLMAEYLLAFYSQKEWSKNNDKTVRMLETILQCMCFNRKVRDINGILSIQPGSTSVNQISDDNTDFWRYYLMVGFGFRNVELGNVPSRRYSNGTICYLPAYMNCLYYPSIQWRKLFTKFDDTRDMTAEPIFTEFTLPDKKRLKVEFHFHYCLYFLDNKPVYKAEYTFEECQEFSKSLEKTEHFFFLLAITSIEKEERQQAAKLIQEWLSRLPLYDFTIPPIARMLAADNAMPVQLPVENITKEEIQAIYYAERERFCFKAIVAKDSVFLSYLGTFGWLLYHEDYEDTNISDRHLWAKTKLSSLMQPECVPLDSVSLEGMDTIQKAENIVKALVSYGTFQSKNKTLLPYEPAFLWKKEESIKPVKEFFRNTGGFVTESYCVLRYGKEKKREELFYFAVKPFESENAHGINYDYQDRIADLEKKVREPHFIVGSIGLCSACKPDQEFVLYPFAIGLSGTYYLNYIYHMHKADNFAALIAKMFDLSNITQVDTYQGLLSISNVDGKFEYRFSKADFNKSAYSMKWTNADALTTFTKAERMLGFADWLDKILEQNISGLGILLFELIWDNLNICSINLYSKNTYELSFESYDKLKQNIDRYCTSILQEHHKFIWKNQKKDSLYSGFPAEFSDILLWYMDYGRLGWKLKDSLKIDIICHNKKEADIYSIVNTAGILDTLKEKTKKKAYLLKMNRDKKPDIFDSKFCGIPYWTPNKEYPTDSTGKKLLLLAQINLDKTPMKEVIDGGGMLQFFGDGEEIFKKGFGNQEDMDKYRVIYHETINYNISIEELEMLGVPDSTDSKYQSYVPLSKELAMDIIPKTVYMNVGDYRFDSVLKETINEKFGVDIGDLTYQDIFEEDLFEMVQEFGSPGNWILGYPEDLTTYPEYPRTDPRDVHKELRKYDQMLFQFDVHYLDCNEYYWKNDGCGIANFYIRSEDIKKKDFEHIMYHWETCP